LQVESAPESRKYTAFLFESQVYQFTRTPYGFRNSLSAFVRALQTTFGSQAAGFALAYVDDITVYSQTYELHLRHLETVIGKLTDTIFKRRIRQYIEVDSEMQRLKERHKPMPGFANARMFSMPAIELEITFLCLDR
jgi:hypothetical protein